VYYNLGFLNLLQDAQKALRFLLQAAKHPQYALAVHLLIGKVKLQENNLSEASAAFLQALRLADLATVPAKQAEDLNQLYEPLLESNSHQKDGTELRKLCETISLQLIRPDWRAYLISARQQLPGQEAGAPPLPLAEMLLESQSSQVVERLAQVRTLARQNKITSAMEEAYHALQYAPNYLPLHVQIGELLLRSGRSQDALTKFMLVAELYNLRGDPSQAIHLLNRVLQASPMNASARNQLIQLLLAQGRSADAVQQYLNLADMYLRLADLDSARQSYANALNQAQAAHLNHSVWIEILLKIADLDAQRLEFRSAIRSLEQVRNLDQNNFPVRAQLIDLLFKTAQDSVALTETTNVVALLEKSGHSDKAVEFLEELVNAHPEKLELRRILANLFQRQGQVDPAAEQLEAMAQGLLASGKRADAVSVLNSILAMKPSAEEKYQKMLQKLK
jgi:tetratricopeptide (TPR) repeat protein